MKTTMIESYTDDTEMPFGKYKGKKLMHVPASYLHWLYTNQCSDSRLVKYIEDNLDALKDEYPDGIWRK